MAWILGGITRRENTLGLVRFDHFENPPQTRESESTAHAQLFIHFLMRPHGALTHALTNMYTGTIPKTWLPVLPVCPAPPGVFGLSNALHSGLHATLAIELWASCSRLRAPACSQTLIFGRTECHTPAQGGTSVSARTPPPFRACVLSAVEIWTSISRLGLCTGTV